jgi:membrane-associated phospholipid phosphatase
MKSLWENSWFTIPYLVLLALGLAYTAYAPMLGEELFLLNAYRAEPLNTFFIYATKLGEPKFVGIMLLLAGLYRPRFALLMLLTALVVWPISYWSKFEIGTPRPIAWLEFHRIERDITLVPGVTLLNGYNSMPSGHTMLAFATFSMATLMLPYRFRQLGLLFFWTAALVGLSRIFLVQHFLRDVLAGSVFGVLISDFVWQFYRRFFVKKR